VSKQVRYYAAFYNGKRWVETIETREATKLVSSVETGTTYRSFKAMDAAIGQKNQAWLA